MGEGGFVGERLIKLVLFQPIVLNHRVLVLAGIDPVGNGFGGDTKATNDGAAKGDEWRHEDQLAIPVVRNPWHREESWCVVKLHPLQILPEDASD